MKVALTYNLRPGSATGSALPDDTYVEWDEPDTIAAVQAALAVAHEVVLIEDNDEREARIRASAPDIVFNLAEGLTGPDREACLPALLDVCFINPLPVLQGFPWERHAPAWLLEPGWSPALPGEGTGTGLTKWTSRFLWAR